MPPTPLAGVVEGEGIASLAPPAEATSSHIRRAGASSPPRPSGGDEGPPIQCAGGMSNPSSSVVGGVRGLFGSGMRGGSLPFQKTIQRSFGPYDISGVKSSSGPLAQRANRMMGSEAMTRGEQVAFKGPTSLHIAAHEAAHVLQHRTGLRIPGGVGTPGDRHERFADQVASGVTSGRSVTSLLDRTVGTRARTAKRPRSDAPVQMFTKVDKTQERKVKERISSRGGTGVGVKLEDAFYTGSKGRGLVATGVASMARDTSFENAAIRFEQGIGTLAYNHSRTKSACDTAGAKVLAYFNAKYAKSRAKTKEIDEGLSDMGISDPGWSGAVGKSARAVRQVLERGSVMERAAHVETFVKDILATDIMENEVDWRSFANTSGYNMGLLGQGYKNVAFTGDRYLIFDTDKDSATGMQWHTRANMEDVRKQHKTGDPFHPSSVKAPKKLGLQEVNGPQPKKKEIKGGEESVTVRDVDRIEKKGPSGMGAPLGAGEKAFQKAKSGDDKTLAWVEGARVFALNELDGWVYAQRQLSLPLVAGTSSTAARIIQSFRFLGAGTPDDARLVAIAAMLVGRHHSLVEVMEAGKRYGTSAYREGPMMYHDIAPLTEKEIWAADLEFPDEYVDPNGVRGGYSIAPEVEEVNEELEEPQLQGMLGMLGLGAKKKKKKQVREAPKDPVVEEIGRLTRRGRSKTFARTRASIKRDLGLWNVFTNRNSAQARMLRAVDAYHAAEGTEAKLAELVKVRDEAAHWLVKHPKWLLGKWASTRAKFMLLRDEADAVLQTHIDEDEASYLTKLNMDELFASSEHAREAMTEIKSGRGEGRYETEAGKLVKAHGLSLAELAAIKVYCGPSYKFINPALEGDKSSVNRRLLGFVREIKLANNNGKSSAQRIREAEQARQKLVKVSDPIKSAISEGELHARHAMRGLAKLPPFTGLVYAGGALTTDEALLRFKTGSVQERKSFASTSAQLFTAGNFAGTKGDKLTEAYESIPERERDPKKAPFPFVLRYVSKTGRDIKDLSVDPGEKEVLFAPGTKLKILRGADSPQAEKKEAFGELMWTYIDAEEVT